MSDAMIHPSAIIEDGAQIDPTARIGPFCVIGSKVVIGPAVELKSHVVVSGNTTIGAQTVVFSFAVIGEVPQDLKFKGETSRLEIGARNRIREHVTMNGGTAGGGGVTRIGEDGLFMAGWAWSSLSWLLIGASFTLLVAAIPGFTIADAEDMPGVVELYLVCTAAISLAVVIGFASLLPGGAGIRELVVTTVLAVSLGATHAILAAIAARVVFAVVEGFVAMCCWLWLRLSGGESLHTPPITPGPRGV